MLHALKRRQKPQAEAEAEAEAEEAKAEEAKAEAGRWQKTLAAATNARAILSVCMRRRRGHARTALKHAGGTHAQAEDELPMVDDGEVADKQARSLSISCNTDLDCSR